MAQFVTRLDDELVEAVDALVAEGIVASRSEAVRRGLTGLVGWNRRQQVGQSIVDGYERVPQTESEVGWADAATEQMIADEPW